MKQTLLTESLKIEQGGCEGSGAWEAGALSCLCSQSCCEVASLLLSSARG